MSHFLYRLCCIDFSVGNLSWIQNVCVFPFCLLVCWLFFCVCVCLNLISQISTMFRLKFICFGCNFKCFWLIFLSLSVSLFLNLPPLYRLRIVKIEWCKFGWYFFINSHGTWIIYAKQPVSDVCEKKIR